MKYKIGKLTYTQEELTVGQDTKILKLVEKIAEKNPEVEIKNIFDLAIRFNVLGILLGIILKPKINIQFILYKIYFTFKWIFGMQKGTYSQVPLVKAPNSTIEKIIEDFFLYNKKTIQKLSKLNNILGWIAQAAMKNSETKDLKKKSRKDSTKKQSSSTPQTETSKKKKDSKNKKQTG